MKAFEAPTITVKEAVLRDIITASAGTNSDVPGVNLPDDPNYGGNG